ncbi:hypothetical protein D3C84_1042850 [compost metagenome]
MAQRMCAVHDKAKGFRSQRRKFERLTSLIREACDDQIEFFLFEHFQQVVAGLFDHLDREEGALPFDAGNRFRQYH